MPHTPGPWKWINSYEALLGPNGEFILEEEIGYDREGATPEGISVSPADAHLIAAAPELLEACKVAIETFDDDAPGAGDTEKGALRRLRAAVARAEGQPNS